MIDQITPANRDLHQSMNKLKSEIMEHFERSVSSEGNLERMQNRVHILERALAHLMAFVAIHLRLTEAEIENEDGLTDF